MKYFIKAVNSLPGEGRSNLLLAISKFIPAGVYTEEVQTVAGTSYNINQSLFSRLERLDLEFGLIARETDTAPIISFGGLHMLTDGPYDRRYTGKTDIKVVLAQDYDIQAEFVSASQGGDYKTLARLQGVPESSLPYRERRRYDQDWAEFVRTNDVPDFVAFAPFKPTLVRDEKTGLYIPSRELELFEEFGRTVQTLSSEIYDDTLRAFKEKLELATV